MIPITASVIAIPVIAISPVVARSGVIARVTVVARISSSPASAAVTTRDQNCEKQR
jgi:hypothetical protein